MQHQHFRSGTSSVLSGTSIEEKERLVWPHAEQLYISIWPRINHSLMQMTLVWIMMMRSLIHHAIVSESGTYLDRHRDLSIYSSWVLSWKLIMSTDLHRKNWRNPLINNHQTCQQSRKSGGSAADWGNGLEFRGNIRSGMGQIRQ